MVAVEYKYANEDEVIISDANSYTYTFVDVVNTTFWQASGIAIDEQSTEGTVRYKSTFVSSPNGSIVLGDYPLNNLAPTSQPWFLVTPDGTRARLGSLSQGNPESLYKEFGGKSIGTAGYFFQMPRVNDPTKTVGVSLSTYPLWVRQMEVYGTQRYSRPDLPPINCITSISAPDYWHPANGDRRYILKVFKNGQLVFSRTEPEVKFGYAKVIYNNSKECPPDTCPVLCSGTQVCCYGSNGIAVDSFLLSESVYQ